MALKLKIKTINASGGQELPIGVVVRFRDRGEFGTNNKTFEIDYKVSDQFWSVKPLIIEEKEVPTYDENEVQNGTETREVKTFLPAKFRCEKSNSEIRQLLSTIDIEDDLTKIVMLYHILVKNRIEEVTGESSVEIDLSVL